MKNFMVELTKPSWTRLFSPDSRKAKVQLAAITALMDDIEPDNLTAQKIIHVVSYSEAVRLATPDIIEDSIKITLGAFKRIPHLEIIR